VVLKAQGLDVAVLPVHPISRVIEGHDPAGGKDDLPIAVVLIALLSWELDGKEEALDVVPVPFRMRGR